MRQRLERVRHLLNLIQIELEACGGCTGSVSRRMEAAMHEIDTLLGITPRVDDGHDHADADAPE